MREIDGLVEAVRREFAPEPRTAIFEVHADLREEGYALTGVSTETDAVDELLRRARAAAAPRPVSDEVVRLPDPSLGDHVWAVVRASVAPLHAAPDVRATQASQYVLGARLELLLAAGRWYRVRGEDGYLGWVNRGYIAAGEEAWARTWEVSVGGHAAVSLGAELVDGAGGPLVRLPWGARVAHDGDGHCILPDGRAAALGRGEIVPASELRLRFPRAGEAIVGSALRWLGTPYLWGGVTMAGADCSGFVQAVCRLHGVSLPRDAELQVAVGTRVDTGAGFEKLRPGDLLFFTEVPGRITHVALSMGGPRLVHSALSNGGVATNDLMAEDELAPALRRMFVEARRVL